MTKFLNNMHRAKRHLEMANSSYRWAWQAAEIARKDIVWPVHIYASTKEFATAAGDLLMRDCDADSLRWLLEQGQEY